MYYYVFILGNSNNFQYQQIWMQLLEIEQIRESRYFQKVTIFVQRKFYEKFSPITNND